jgi:hypothetical protein
MLVIVAVVVGVFVLTKAFPTATSGAEVPQTQPPAPEVPQDQPSLPSPEPEPEPSPQIVGVTLSVLNGTTKSGLAAETAEVLENEGYDIVTVGNAATQYETTTLFYRDREARIEALHLRRAFFHGAFLEAMPDDQVNEDVQVSVVLGSDYAEGVE